MGNVAKRPDGKWRARYRDPDGKERASHFDTKAGAKKWLARIEGEIVRGQYVDPKAGKRPFGEFAEEWFAGQTFEVTTRTNVRARLRKHIYPTFEHRELRTIRPSLVQSWVKGLQASGLAPRTVRNIVATFSSILNAAVDDDLIARNPVKAKAVTTPRVPVRQVEPWPHERVQAIIAALPERYEAMAAVAAGAGLRQGEVFGLRVEDVDFLKRTIRVRQQVRRENGRPTIAPPKANKTRDVPMAEALSLILAEHVRKFPPGPNGLLFTTRFNRPMDREYFNPKVWRVALKAAEIPDSPRNGMHALRHYYASVLLDAGVSVRALADHLGHTDPGFTLRTYTHLIPATTDRAAKAIDEAFGRSAISPQRSATSANPE